MNHQNRSGFPASGEFPEDEPLSAVGLRLRAAAESDIEFLKRLYTDWRLPEFLSLPWAEGQKLAIIEGQFHLQHRQFIERFHEADFWIVTDYGGGPIGRLYLDRSKAKWRLIEILLASECRGNGLGSHLIKWLQTGAAVARASIVLDVAADNSRAREFYLRHGFIDSASDGREVHREMHWPGAGLDRETPGGP